MTRRFDQARATTWALALMAMTTLGNPVAVRAESQSAAPTSAAPPTDNVTFSKDIAPIVYKNCANCHRAGQSGPFPLLTYSDVKKHARDITTVRKSRSMPPWQPEPGFGEFASERRLTEKEINLIEVWVQAGAVEGNPAQLPALPSWSDWQLGEPDLTIRMPQTYTLPASGKDVYRNFVIPIPISKRRHVQAVELHPENRSAHHAFLYFDRTGQSRRIDARDPEPGFPGMSPPTTASAPPGQFLSWQPGKSIARGTADSIWTLEPGTDLVLQLHLQPTGKPELIQASVGFYFTETPPNPALSKIGFISYAIDIPPGATNYTVTDSYVLPVDVAAVGVLPHAHYLGKQIEGFATLPDGTQKWLLLIKHWDFNWQGDYQFREPVPLPKGSTLTMRWTYDNSTNNIHNPNSPPIRVQYGPNTTNEMAELSFRVRLRNATDLDRLQADMFPMAVKNAIEFNTWRLAQDPQDATAHARLGQALLAAGAQDEAAFRHLQTAVRLGPDLDEAHYGLGLLLRDQQRLAAARREFETVLRLNPDHSKAYGNLGFILAEQGFLDQSEHALRRALQLDPEDSAVQAGLTQLLQAREKLKK